MLTLDATTPLADWLAYLETLHPKPIALGLERVSVVASRLSLTPSCPVFTVTGTNGKGSVCAYLDAMLRAAGYRVGLYTSPHLLRYNERVRIDGVEASDAELTKAFAAIDAARGDTSLTYFEFGTIAALWLFAQQRLDALVLEVGLGGRLDAVNIIDADVAIVSGIGIDHVDYLGGTRDSIAVEKAGIFRRGKPGVCADPDPPATLLAHAAKIGAPLHRIGVDFGFMTEVGQWQFWMRRVDRLNGDARRQSNVEEDRASNAPHADAPSSAAIGASPAALLRRSGLPLPALRGAVQVRNAAAAVTALELAAPRLAVPMQAIRDGLVSVVWPARFQVLPGRPSIVLDVAHNPQASTVLASNLGDMGYFPQTTAVFSILGDKDIEGVAETMRARIDRWLIAPSEGARGASAPRIRDALIGAGVAPDAIVECASVHDALMRATSDANEADRIVVFGSFVTVAAALRALERTRSGPDRLSTATGTPHGVKTP